MTVAVTIGGKVDTAETGDGGDFKLCTTVPLDKISPPFPSVVLLRNPKKANGALTLHTVASKKDAQAMWRRHDCLADWLTG